MLFTLRGQNQMRINMKSTTTLAILLATTPLLLAAPDLTKMPPASDKKDLTYAKDIQPMFKESCMRCHGAERPKAGLRLDSVEAVLKGSKDGKVVQPGKPLDSQLLIAVSQLDPKTAMPPKRRARGPGGQPPAASTEGDRKEGEQKGGPGGGPGGHPPAPPLTAEQVGIVRAWIAQGAK